MKTKAVVMNLRVAKPSDFADQFGNKKLGCIYFQQSFKGNFCTQPYYFTLNTELETFRELFANKQIWVPVGVFDEVDIIEFELEKN